jgi:ribonuclease D
MSDSFNTQPTNNNSSTEQHFEWVSSDERLTTLALQWQTEKVIALDTEFIRSRTFFPKIGLLQIADSKGIYLIDQLSIDDIKPLQDIMTNQNLVKVIHSCSEDLEVFQHYLSALPTPLFDTQIAAAFAGYGASIGYAGLVNAIQGDEIPKQETRSDWLQRPLSDSQLRYAALDVEHLLLIHKQLSEELTDKSRLLWAQHECEALLQKYQQPQQHSQYYQRIKSAWKLKPYQLSVLQELCAWREQAVREINIPRSHLVKDSVLWEMAQRTPENLKQLRRLRDIPPRFIEKYGEHCLSLIESALDDNRQHPERLPAPLSVDQVTIFKQLKAQVVSVADTLKIPPELLARKAEIESLVRVMHDKPIPLPVPLQGWRHEIIGQLLLDHLSKEVLPK